MIGAEKPVEVIIVEDSADDSELTEFAIKQASGSIHFKHFSDGIDALDFIFAKKKYEGYKTQTNLKFVLLDIGLPTMNGLDVLKKIREDSITCTIPVIILSASTDERDRTAAYKLGANSYVIKPNGYDGYVNKIKSLAFYWSSVNEKFRS